MLNPSAPMTWVTGQVVTATQLNTEVRDRANIVGEHILAQTVLSAAAATVDLVQIPQGYESVRVTAIARGTVAANFTQVGFQFSSGTSTAPAFDSSTAYDWDVLLTQGVTPSGSPSIGSSYAFAGWIPGSSGQANFASQIDALICGYSRSVFQKSLGSNVSHRDSTAAAGAAMFSAYAGAFWRNTGPIQAIRVLPISGGNFSSGTVITIYGRRTTSTSS